jgi:hypothetical protein
VHDMLLCAAQNLEQKATMCSLLCTVAEAGAHLNLSSRCSPALCPKRLVALLW